MVGPMNDIAFLLGAPARAIAFAGLAALTCLPAANAGELPDPTRPPMAQRHVGSGPVTVKAAGPVLQSVMTGEGRKPSVIISGRALELGDSFDDMKLTQVSETGAVLSGAHGTTTLALTPGSDKSFAAAASTDRVAATALAQPMPRRATPAFSYRLPEEK
jgi:hypothetical protein